MSGASSSRTTVVQRVLVALQVVLLLATLIGPAAVMANEPPAESAPSPAPSAEPSPEPSAEPSAAPSAEPTAAPTADPSTAPDPTTAPTSDAAEPTVTPTAEPMPVATPVYTPSGPPSIASDLADYPPGAAVALTGSNWQAGESVHIFVNDDIGTTWSRNVDVTADSSGRIADVFHLPDWFVATYRVLATGAQSGMATTTFTDGNVKVKSEGGRNFGFTVQTFNGSSNCSSGGGAISGPQTADSNGSTVGVGNTDSIRIVANLNANTPNTAATFIAWQNPNGLTIMPNLTTRTICVGGNFNGSKDIVGIYGRPPVADDETITASEDVAVNTSVTTLLTGDTDGDSATLTITAVSGASGGTAVLNNNGTTGTASDDFVTFTPSANLCGAAAGGYDYTVSDGALTDTGHVTVSITCVNDAPAGTDGSATFDEDTSYTFGSGDFGFTDPNDSPDNAFASVVITTLPASGSLKLSGVVVTAGQEIAVANLGNLVFTPAANANGAGYASFTFQVRDNGGTANGGVNLDQSANTFTLNVTSVNDAPELASVGSKSIDEGSGLAFTANAFDIDGDTLTYSLADGTTDCGDVTSCVVPAGASINPSTGAFAWTPPDNGTFRIKVVVQDSGVPMLSDSEDITITVDNVAPTVTLLGLAAADEGDTNSYTYSWTDPGSADTFPALGNAISCGVNGTASDVVFDAVTQTGSFKCTWSDDSGAGTTTVSAKITDDDGGTHTDTIAVDVDNVNPTPTINGAPTSSPEGTLISLTSSVSDPGTDDTFTYAWSVTKDGLAYGSGGTLSSFGFTPNDNASYVVTLVVTDDDGGSGTTSETITVDNVAPTTSNPAFTFDPVTHIATAKFDFADVGTADSHLTTYLIWTIDGVDQPASMATVTELNGSGTATSIRVLATGCYTISVRGYAVDDDGGVSSSQPITTSYTADAYAASFQAPIKADERNIAKYGNVVPVKVELRSSCSGATVTTPVLHITIATGDDNLDPTAVEEITAVSVSSADTGTQMRINGGGYIYNLSTRSMKIGQEYTIRIRVGNAAGPIILRALFQPKK